MSRDRLRVLVLGGTSVILVLACTFGLDWFRINVGRGILDEALGGAVGFDLRTIHGCANGNCSSISFSKLSGGFDTLAPLVFFESLGFALLVAIQTYTKVMSGSGSDKLARVNYTVAVLLFVLTVFAGYLLAPQFPATEMFGFTLSIDRTWAPALMLLAAVTGLMANYSAVTQDDRVAFAPVLPVARVVPAAAPVPPVDVPAPVRASVTPIPNLQYATATATLSRAGLDARREDGTALLVMWRDVVGVVVRRLPEPLDGHTFIDVVSTAGATLRLLPWTRLDGDPLGVDLDDVDFEPHARAIVAHIVAHAPAATLDAGTRAFVDGGATTRPTQVPDLATLAILDARLA
ncbi:MAG: hypothetical protein NT062_27095 [Proteobacteria bacterium]|nr:hypothetical protein [Pseudomonadota bacterium]